MPPRLDPEEKATKIQVVAPPAWVAKVDAWRALQGAFPPNRSEAIRYLVEKAIAAEGKSEWWDEPTKKR